MKHSTNKDSIHNERICNISGIQSQVIDIRIYYLATAHSKKYSSRRWAVFQFDHVVLYIRKCIWKIWDMEVVLKKYIKKFDNCCILQLLKEKERTV